MYVYTITHLPSGRKYVGKTNNPAKRWKAHLYIARVGHTCPNFRYIHRAIRKYGADQFSFDVVESCVSEEEALRREAIWVKLLGADDTTGKKGFNLASGGEQGKSLSEETKRKIALRAKGRKQGPHSEEHKARMGLSHIGKHHSADTRAKMSVAIRAAWARRQAEKTV